MGKAALWAEVQEARALSSTHTPAHGRRASLQPATVLHPGILAGSIRASLILTAARSHLEEGERVMQEDRLCSSAWRALAW